MRSGDRCARSRARCGGRHRAARPGKPGRVHGGRNRRAARRDLRGGLRHHESAGRDRRHAGRADPDESPAQRAAALRGRRQAHAGQGRHDGQQFAAAQAESGFNVWRSWDEPGGIRDQMHAVARDNPQLAKLVRLGTTVQGREILAVKLTQGARGAGRRPPAGGALQLHPARARVDRRPRSTGG